jgi:hypothetical protein
MKTVELIYDHDCPNIEQARANLLHAFSEAGGHAEWVEWDRGDPSCPSHVRSYGSPTVLVNEKDVAGTDPSENIACCRLYADANGSFNGAPSVEMIATALRNIHNGLASKNAGRRRAGWQSSLAILPGIGTSLLPVGVCPACWPAYAGLLSSLGFGFLLETAYLLPLTALFFSIAVAALAYKARTRRGYRPFTLGLVASSIVLVGKFIFESDTAMYGGIAMLIAASLWNAWPWKNSGDGKDTCLACASRGTDAVIDKNGGTNERKEVLP